MPARATIPPPAITSKTQLSPRRKGGNVVASNHVPMYLSPYQTSYRRLMNGTIDHGLQFLSPQLKPEAHVLLQRKLGNRRRASCDRAARGALRVGVNRGWARAFSRPTANGLATATRSTRSIRSTCVLRKANSRFCAIRPAKIDIVLGDARLSLESEAPQQFDALVVDAFSSDSIPVHLLTREAFEIYFRHLKPDGVLALHISNQYLNLQPVVEAAAVALQKEAVLVNNGDNYPQGIYSAAWILLGNDPQGFFGQQEMEGAGAILLPTRSRDTNCGPTTTAVSSDILK